MKRPGRDQAGENPVSLLLVVRSLRCSNKNLKFFAIGSGLAFRVWAGAHFPSKGAGLNIMGLYYTLTPGI